jgi:hypothetical protein
MNKEIKMWTKFLVWFNNVPEKEMLTEDDIKSLGFKETLTKGHIMYFKKGNMSLKWDFHVTHRQVVLKWGKSIRYIGIIETKNDLVMVLWNINKYYGKGEK